MDFQPLAHGEHLGPIRLTDTIDYRVRIGDRIQFIFARNRESPVESYTLLVGDELQITSLSNPELKMGDLIQGRGIAIQPDGYLHLNAIGKIRAAGLSIEQLRRNLEVAYRRFYAEPGIDVLPIKTNTQQDDILDSIDARQGISGGRTLREMVHPDGTVRLIPIGSVMVQGLTMDEVKREVNLRYRQLVPGLHIEPIIEQEAPHYVFVYGEVGQPDRYQLLGPTSVTQALAMARGVNPRGNAREIVIFRRAEDWRLLATRLDLQGMHLGKVPSPADEIWLRDNDLIIVPRTPISRFNDFVDQVFRQGIYGVFPFSQVGSGFNAIGFPVR
jgi:polysaccharide biosynthesis/export protein